MVFYKNNKDKWGSIDSRKKGEVEKHKEKDIDGEVGVDKIGAHPFLQWILLNVSLIVSPCF